jgi:hypothetical protein
VSANAVADVAPKHIHAIQTLAAAAVAVAIVTPSALPRADPNPLLLEARRQRGVDEGFFATLSESAASKCLMLRQVVRQQFTLRFTCKLQAKECGSIGIQFAHLSRRRWLSPRYIESTPWPSHENPAKGISQAVNTATEIRRESCFPLLVRVVSVEFFITCQHDHDDDASWVPYSHAQLLGWNEPLNQF